MARVIYIAGYGRSGSTILDRFLAAHPAISGGGELFRAPEIFADDEAKCTCGTAFRDCGIWRDMRQTTTDLAARYGGAIRLRRAMRRVEGRQALRAIMAGRGGDHALKDWTALANGALAAVAAAKPNATWMVDSSKTARAAAARPLRLINAGHDVRVILMSRRLPHVLSSVAKGLNRNLEAGHRSRQLLTLPGAVIGWILAEAANQALRRYLPKDHTLVVSYEDLTAKPAATAERIARWLNLDAAPIIAAMEHGALPGHMIGGNRNRFGKQTLALNPIAPQTDPLTAIARKVARLWSRVGYAD